MQYTITRTCGHQTSEQLYGKGSERERRLAWLKSQPCLACTRQGKRQNAATAPQIADLPVLVGTEKQVAWALTIRAEKLAAIDAIAADIRERGDRAVAAGQVSREDADTAIAAEVAPAVAKARMMDSAAFWIDHRGESTQDLLRMFAPVAAHI